MAALLFFILFATSTHVKTHASSENCPTVRCGHNTPDIHFPFWVKGQQSQRCGSAGFELVCKENTTMIHLPSYGNLIVKSISYKTKKLDLIDPGNCVHGVFLNLNLSLSRFRYYYVVKNYTFLNCSARLPPSFAEVPCLSGPRHHFYNVKYSSAVPVPSSCRAVKTLAIPFAYSPYISDNSFGLGLTWDSPRCEECEAKGGKTSFLPEAQFLNIAQDGGKILIIAFSNT